MIRFYAVWFAPVAATLLTCGLSATTMAQTIYPFEAIYNSENTLVPIAENISKVTITAETGNAPYGLTKFVNTNYGLINRDAGTIIFEPDAAKFGKTGLPLGGVTFFGQGNDNLFGTISGTAALDFQNLVGTASGTVTITGGSGRFSGATGKLSFLENDILSLDPTAPIKSRAVVSGSFKTFQSVPEPRNTTTLVVMGVIGFGLLLRRRSLEVAG